MEKELYRSVRSRSDNYDIKVEIETGDIEQGMKTFNAMRETCRKINRRLKRDSGSGISYEVKFYLVKDQ